MHAHLHVDVSARIGAEIRFLVAQLSQRTPDGLLIADLRLARDLARHQDLAICGKHLHRDAGGWVLLQMFVQNGVRDLVAQLVRVRAADALRRYDP